MIPSRTEFVRATLVAAALIVSASCSEPASDRGISAGTAHPSSASPSSAYSLTTGAKFLVIAHRGASGYRPEHTLAAYQLAIDQGADFIEPDLVPTKDGVLIARHENALAVVALLGNNQIERDANGKPKVVSATTDVAERPEFAHLLRVGQIDGRAIAGWFSEDFTFAEIQTLYARERIPKLRPNNTAFNRLRIPSLEQILDLLQQPGNSQVGMYPELKHPTHFRFGKRNSNDWGEPGPNPEQAIAIDTARLLTKKLADRAFTDAARLYIQCFELETLRRLKHQLLPEAKFSAPLVQLISGMNFDLPDVALHKARAAAAEDPEAYLEGVYGPLTAALMQDGSYRSLIEQLDIVAADYASGVGPRKSDARIIAKQTQELGLELHPYTVRAEPYFLSRVRGALANSVSEELDELRALGATGVFIDQPDLAVQWRSEL